MIKIKCLYPRCGEYFLVNLTAEQIKFNVSMDMECPFCRKTSTFNRYNLKIINIIKGDSFVFDELGETMSSKIG
jgi:hypothetical protein